MRKVKATFATVFMLGRAKKRLQRLRNRIKNTHWFTENA